MKKSCGVLLNCCGKYLLAHSTGHGRMGFGIPKGMQDAGETDKETALRELFEETNIKLAEADLSEKPFISYRAKSGKAMVVFSAEISDVPDNMFCSTLIPNSGRPEVDSYLWATKDEALDLLINHMKTIFEAL